MPRLELTRAAIAAIEPAGSLVEYQDTKQPGLCLRVTPNGAKSWTLRYRLKNGARKRIALGSFPALPVSLARTEAAKVIGSVARGEDPVGDLKKERKTEKRQKLETVEAVGERYLIEAAAGRHRMKGKPKRASSLEIERRYFEKVIKPAIGKERLADLTRADLQAVVNDAATSKSPSAARHSRNTLQRIFAFAVWQDIVVADPTRFVSAPTWKDRERVLTDDELRALWTALDAVPDTEELEISTPMVLAIKLAAVMLQRRGEVIGMRKVELDLGAKLWTIPGERTKNHRTHVVPLSDLAVDLIREALALSGNGPMIFPSPRDPEKPMGAMALTHAWRRLLPHVLVPAPTAKNPDRKKPIVDVVPHDLRRTGATSLTSERIGMPRFIVSRVLNHASDRGDGAAVTAVYDRNAYLPEKRQALEAWAALLTEIVSGHERETNVVRMAG